MGPLEEPGVYRIYPASHLAEKGNFRPGLQTPAEKKKLIFICVQVRFPTWEGKSCGAGRGRRETSSKKSLVTSHPLNIATTTAVPEAGITGGRTPPTVFEKLRARQKKEQERISG